MLAVLLCLTCFGAVISAHAETEAVAEPAASLKVREDPAGGFRAHGTVQIAAPPSVVQAILTDYAHWPDLFDTSIRIVAIDQRDDRVLTDLYVEHFLLFGGHRLYCENKELRGGGLTTTLLEGDFKQYARTWRLRPDGDETATLAELDLLVEVETWAPDWLVARMLERELNAHFRLVKEKAEGRVPSD